MDKMTANHDFMHLWRIKLISIERHSQEAIHTPDAVHS